MNLISKQVLLMTVPLFVTGLAVAQDDGTDDDGLDLTMVLMPENAALPDAVTRIIELPSSVADQATDDAAQGLARANEARENRATGLDNAAEARESGSEFGQSMRELAQETRENSGRGERPEVPVPPGLPGPPNVPGPPN